MKVVFKKTMLEQLQEARHDALKNGKEIEKVVVTVAEAKQLLEDCGIAPYAPGQIVSADTPSILKWLFRVKRGYGFGQQPEFKVLGIRIEVER